MIITRYLPITFVACTFLVACSNTNKGEPEAAPPKSETVITLSSEQMKNASIETAIPESRIFSNTIRLNGKIEVPPQNLVSISVPLGGYLKSTDLMPGTKVRKGQILAILEDPQYIQLQQEFLTAQAQLSFDEGEFNRQRELNQSKASSDKNFEQARMQYQTRIILMKSLEQKLKLIGINPENLNANNINKSIQIKSPVNGFVSEVHANIGKYITPGETLFDLIDPEDIHLMLTVFEKDVAFLSTGQKVEAYTNQRPDQKYPCKIVLISRRLSKENATEVHCHFDKYDHKLLPGMFMNAEIQVNSKSSPCLPESAVVRYKDSYYVFADRGNNQFEMLPVVAGSTHEGYTALELTKEDAMLRYVTKGAYQLLMALKNVSEE
ncbi:MAG: efflux RND transporter periplasmic adaptor subunit [Saprospiraceae bacterium]|nr:efflux RND transporter periplasmic adaptor subunit [Saprospiraceae bacterium]HMW38344.1 efflux RND transporter periplasmic adaptor subunit [Saprospiraceae bacterium]HMX87888.1 efflux RND transporter periplasmic adaptor subunit [Saprospiraceae bacterium]HMZ39736.1 efflux RND transporter periplasmic adaptor subunit [Saprospiraceae bacterium]HNA63393.1 efflux RND transporter periplasmic adaptor subunit [Saprospiraceae bacterium]